MLRQPIVTIMGHVDHGKTSILDKIRGSAVAAKEAGGITQAIGASIIPLGTIQIVCGPLLKAANINFTIPGLLFIDTPGHAAFTNLRKRGGNLADIAIVVIDLNDGLQPQTLESIEVLRSYKTPFVIAANKLDTLSGWDDSDEPVLAQIAKQRPHTITEVETKIYEIVGKMYELGIECERFDRIQDYTKQIAIVPVSAMTGSGIPELLMTISGLAQKYLENNLQTNIDAPAKGTVLEVKDQKGLGKVIDAIIYDGTIKVGDKVVVGGLKTAVVTKVKGLFEPVELQEIRDDKSNFQPVKSVSASTGVRILAPNIDDVVAGMPIIGYATNSEEAEVVAKVQSEVSEVLVETDDKGIVIKADSLGSLEALSHLLKEKNIPVRKASIGPITKKDFADIEAAYVKDPMSAIILGFNIPSPQLSSENVHTLTNTIIYKLIEDYEAWVEAQNRKIQLSELNKLNKPCKIKVLKQYIFRQSNPAVVGIEVLNGTLYSNTPLINLQGQTITTVKGLQENQENIDKAEQGKQIACSLPRVTIGRQVNGDDVLYSGISEDEFRKYKEFKKFLSQTEKDLLKEIAAIMRENNPVWGI